MENPLAFGEQGDFYISFGVRILWDTNCIRFGKIALLFAFVLFAGSCVVRIAYESFLDDCFQEIPLLLEWRTAFVYFS